MPHRTFPIMDVVLNITRLRQVDAIEGVLMKALRESFAQGALYLCTFDNSGEVRLGLHDAVIVEDVGAAHYALVAHVLRLVRERVEEGRLPAESYQHEGQSCLLVADPEAFTAQSHRWFILAMMPTLDAEVRVGLERLLQIAGNVQALLREKDRDKLTGLLNRQQLEDRISHYLSEPSVTDTTLHGDRRQAVTERHWLALLDIDHFKAVNDNFGHLYGDEVLLLLSQLMQHAFRRQDQLFRYGGEEFVILMPGVGQQGAELALNRFRERIEHHRFPQVGKVTVSIGMVEIGAASTVPSVLGQADAALYWAKRHGRNRVASYEKLLASGELKAVDHNTGVELF